MKPLGNQNRHVLLVNGMAKAAGADLTAAFEAGALSQAGYAQIVSRCRGCTQSDACETLLRSRDGVADIPDYCCNSRTLKALVPD